MGERITTERAVEHVGNHAGINIAERRIPQDGRLSVNAHGKKIDLRVATLPTVWGEFVRRRAAPPCRPGAARLGRQQRDPR